MEAMLRLVPEWLSDLVLTLAVATVAVGNATHHSHPRVAVSIALVGSLALLRRRQNLLPVLVIETVLAAVLVAYGVYWLLPGVAVAVGTVAATMPRERSLQLTGLSVGALSVAGLVGPHQPAQRLIPSVILVAVAWFIGDRKQAVDREREERSKRAVLAERARIARELHDVISHNVSVMVVQAAAGHDVFDTHPERARSALSAVEETGRRALAELRKLLDVGEDGDGTAPQPGLALVDELAERVRGAGLEVELTVEGTPRAVPEALDLSAYRIVQEALTNTLKHAHASRAEVRVRYEPDALEVEVSDDGIGPTGSAGDGRGLIGMRERVSLFGGELLAGATAAGGFLVRARMPLESA
jgi:signal transduction histidine kinase